MRLQPQLYIDTSGNPFGEASFERVEFFSFESIELSSTIQDVRDISKVFTDYSKSFSIPASKINNKLFSHYYNTFVDNGFDARIKQRAEIYLNGIIFKVGYVSLNEAIVKKGKSHSYNITFFGSLSTLTSTLGGDQLSDLSSLDKYNHEYNVDTVYDGFNIGLGLSGTSMVTSTSRDIIYPAISADAHWYYDSSASTAPVTYNQGLSRNLYNSGATGAYGIAYTDLKPAIKTSHIIDAISEKYSSLEFSGDFFGSSEFNDVYMLMSNNKGVLSPTSSEINDKSMTYRLGTNDSNSDFVEDASSVEELRPLTTYWELTNVSVSGNTEYRVYQYALDIIVSATVKSGGGANAIYDVKVFKGAVLVDQFIGLQGDQTVQYVMCTQEHTTWDDLKIEIASVSTELTQYELDLSLEKRRYKMYGNTDEFMCDISNFGGVPVTSTSLYSTAVVGVQNMVSNIEVTRNMPKIKIIDFLKGLFNMFNLTAYVNDAGVTVVLPLNDYYRAGTSIDITGSVDKNELSIKRMPTYRNIDFKFSEPKTFGIQKKNELTNSEYGDLSYDTSNNGTSFDLAFDGKDYNIKLPFEKIYYERMHDQNNILSRTEMGWGWLVSDEESPVLTKPLLFYNNVQSVENSTRDKIGFVGKASRIPQYNRPANTNAKEYYNLGTTSWVTTAATKSLNFNAEFDEFTDNLASNGLFRKYYNNYIKSVFDKRTRIFSLKMKASLKFLLTYKLNDTLLLAGDEFLINKIRTDLTTGLTNLELISKFFIEDADTTVGAALTAPQGLGLVFRNRNAIVINWTANPLEELVKKYVIYVGGVRFSTDLDEDSTTSYTLTGLTASTSYDITIRAFNSLGASSTASSALTVVTLASDTEAPTAPSAPVVESVAAEFSQATISWIASTDNVTVTEYKVYRDDVLQGTTTSLTYPLNIVSGTPYEVFIRAYDAAGNYTDSPITQIRVSF